MKPAIEQIFDDVDLHYLKPPILKEINTYVVSLGDRVNTYRLIRDREITWMQTVADQLEKALAEESTYRLEKALKHAMLGMRHCSMAMLMDDANHVNAHFLPWLKESMEVNDLGAINSILYPALVAQMEQNLNDRQMGLFRPFFAPVQEALIPQTSFTDESLLTVAGLF